MKLEDYEIAHEHVRVRNERAELIFADNRAVVLQVVPRVADFFEPSPVGLDAEPCKVIFYSPRINCFFARSLERDRAGRVALWPNGLFEQHLIAARGREPSQRFLVQQEDSRVNVAHRR